MPAIGMIVLEHLASALFKIGSCYQLKICVDRHSFRAIFSGRRFHDKPGDIQAFLFKDRRKYNFIFPSGPVLRKYLANRLQLRSIASRGFQDTRDLLFNRLNSDASGNLTGKNA